MFKISLPPLQRVIETFYKLIFLLCSILPLLELLEKPPRRPSQIRTRPPLIFIPVLPIAVLCLYFISKIFGSVRPSSNAIKSSCTTVCSMSALRGPLKVLVLQQVVFSRGELEYIEVTDWAKRAT